MSVEGAGLAQVAQVRHVRQRVGQRRVRQNTGHVLPHVALVARDHVPIVVLKVTTKQKI